MYTWYIHTYNTIQYNTIQYNAYIHTYPCYTPVLPCFHSLACFGKTKEEEEDAVFVLFLSCSVLQKQSRARDRDRQKAWPPILAVNLPTQLLPIPSEDIWSICFLLLQGKKKIYMSFSPLLSPFPSVGCIQSGFSCWWRASKTNVCVLGIYLDVIDCCLFPYSVSSDWGLEI